MSERNCKIWVSDCFDGERDSIGERRKKVREAEKNEKEVKCQMDI